MDFMKEGSLFSYINTSRGTTTLAIVIIAVTALVLITRTKKISVFNILGGITNKLIAISGKLISKTEQNYHRDYEIGKITDKMWRVRFYRILNDLIIDLGLKQLGATPYEFLFLCLVFSFVASLVLCKMLFGSIFMTILLFVPVSAFTLCVMFTRANIAHDTRIENVIEAENILCSNIKDGIVVAVRNSIGVLPDTLKIDFIDFVDNVEHKNYHIKTALLELNQRLGSISDDFIKKCIVFETEEEHGIVGMFKDVVELNNIKLKMRTEMKRKFEEVTQQFMMGAGMIFVFLGGVLAIYPTVAHFYLKTILGQLIIVLDILLMIAEFVYITQLRAKEL